VALGSNRRRCGRHLEIDGAHLYRPTVARTGPVADDDRTGHTGMQRARERIDPVLVEGRLEPLVGLEVIEVPPQLTTDVVRDRIAVDERHGGARVDREQGRREACLADRDGRTGAMARGPTASTGGCRLPGPEQGERDAEDDKDERSETHPREPPSEFRRL